MDNAYTRYDDNLKNSNDNDKILETIKQWLLRYNINRKDYLSKNNKRKRKKKNETGTVFSQSCIVLKGHHGVGKTYAINKIIKDCNYEVKNIDFKSPQNLSINKFVEKMNDKNDVTRYFGTTKIKKKRNVVIVIDNVESIISPTENKNIVEFIKSNEMNWYYPVILISTKSHNKLLNKFKDVISLEIRVPTNDKMVQVLKDISKEEKLIFNKKAQKTMIDYCQGDLRRLSNIILDIKITYKKNRISDKIVENHLKIFDKKDLDIGLYDATNILINSYSGVQKSLKYYEVDKVKIPIMIHQYYIERIVRANNKNIDKYEIADIITKYISEGDVIENFIYGDQNWNLCDLHGFYTCALPSYYLNKGIKDKSEIEYSFAKDLNRTSIKKINTKNINKTNSTTKNKNIYDYIYMIKIFRTHLERNESEKCAKMLKSNDISLSDFESLLKIDKIKNSKTRPLTSKQKKEIMKYLD